MKEKDPDPHREQYQLTKSGDLPDDLAVVEERLRAAAATDSIPELPDSWREKIISCASGTAMETPGPVKEADTRQVNWNWDGWLDTWLPGRWAWGALAGVWLVILALRFSTPEGSVPGSKITMTLKTEELPPIATRNVEPPPSALLIAWAWRGRGPEEVLEYSEVVPR